MTKYVTFEICAKQLQLPNGTFIVLVDTLGKPSKVLPVANAQNIFCIEKTGKVIWQVFSDFDSDGGPFTNIFESGGEIFAYRWDGGTYAIDLTMGRAIPRALQK